MTTVRPFRFAVSANQAASRSEWNEIARRTEAVGCEALLVSDHLGQQMEPYVAALAAADATQALRVGTQVACNDFRHPVLHAKEVATVDLLSDGRAEWGMGAGWIEPEYDAAGLDFEPGPERAARLEEAVTVMKRLFTGEPVTHDGTYYSLAGQVGAPVPLARPHPPLTIGAAQRRLLTFAGREADVVSVAPSLSARRLLGREPLQTVEQAVDGQVEWVSAGAAGRPAPPVLAMTASPVEITDAPEQAAERHAGGGLRADEVLRSPHALIGSVEDVCDSLRARRERWGISHWTFAYAHLERATPIIERLAGT